MKTHELISPHVQVIEARPAANTRWMAFSRWLRENGIPKSTGYKWQRAGLVRSVSINGRRYLSADEIARFWRDAELGKYATTRKPRKSQ